MSLEGLLFSEERWKGVRERGDWGRLRAEEGETAVRM